MLTFVQQTNVNFSISNYTSSGRNFRTSSSDGRSDGSAKTSAFRVSSRRTSDLYKGQRCGLCQAFLLRLWVGHSCVKWEIDVLSPDGDIAILGNVRPP